MNRKERNRKYEQIQATLILQGNTKIYGNTSTSNKLADDIMMGGGGTLDASGLTEGAYIGVNYCSGEDRNQPDGNGGCVVDNLGTDTARVAGYFFSNQDGYGLKIENTSQLALRQHTHSWSYKAENNVITATCAEDDPLGVSCGESKKPTLTLDASNCGKIYNGNAITAPTITASTNWSVTTQTATPEISYSGTLANGDAYESTTEKPVEAGTYTASITIEGKMATTDSFTISPKAVTVTDPTPATLTYTGSQQNLLATEGSIDAIASDGMKLEYQVKQVDEDGKETVVSAWSEDIPKAQDVGTYKVYYKIKNADTYKNYTIAENDKNGSKLVTANIKKQTASASVEPSANDLIYNGNDQTLITAGESTTGTIKYRLEKSEEWTKELPTGKAAGEYVVYYKVFGDSNHEDSAEIKIENVEIKKKTITNVTGLVAKDKIHDGDATADIVVNDSGLTFTGRIEGDTLSLTEITGKFADGADIGDNKAVEVTATLIGASKDNYELAANAISGLTASIKGITVTFDVNGGSISVSPVTGLKSTDKVTQPTAPTKEGYRFIGWFTDKADATTSWNFADPVLHVRTLYAMWEKVAQNNTHKISGTVKESGGSGMANVKVELRLGVKLLATANTDSNGYYEFNLVEPGEYNVIAISDTKTKTEKAVIESSDKELNIELPSEVISSVLDLKEETKKNTAVDMTKIVVGGLDDAATSEAVTGKSVEIKMEVTQQTESLATPEMKKEIDEIKALDEAKGKTLEYLDFDITKTVKSGGSIESTDFIHNTTHVLELIIPFTFGNKQDVKVFRYHGTSAEAFTLETTKPTAPKDATYYLDKENNKIYIYANQFSLYSVGYTEPASVGGESNSVGGSGSGEDSGDSSTNHSVVSTAVATAPQADNAANTNTSPKTGDDFNPALWLMIILAGCVGMIGTYVYRRKQQGNEKNEK